ncbi:MAG: hypothetical protein SFY92_05990 [Verrucomicrobiae bacterium]|nr:hypothetical protein [Verrucomicrobiae bacterium]
MMQTAIEQIPALFKRWEKKDRTERPTRLTIRHYSQAFTDPFPVLLLEWASTMGIARLSLVNNQLAFTDEGQPPGAYNCFGMDVLIDDFLMLTHEPAQASGEAIRMANFILEAHDRTALFEVFVAARTLGGHLISRGTDPAT